MSLFSDLLNYLKMCKMSLSEQTAGVVSIFVSYQLCFTLWRGAFSFLDLGNFFFLSARK